ncbi:conserved hypothetical protein [Treponema phagedenis]|uniref:Uncharacterized protein n=1 Tax=Treponema phagedenis TaxID=162 RepID=A0A0B7GVS6_TREPH|nr:conserved hypothetical protein [Treponema phagedenis]
MRTNRTDLIKFSFYRVIVDGVLGLAQLLLHKHTNTQTHTVSRYLKIALLSKKLNEAKISISQIKKAVKIRIFRIFFVATNQVVVAGVV